MADGTSPALERHIRASDLAAEPQPGVVSPDDGSHLGAVLTAFLAHPFYRLTDDQARELAARAHPPALRAVIAARHAAANSTAPRYAVFCMPKSGSSFVQSAIQNALQLPFVSLTSFGAAGVASNFGMNAREQELDELALVKSIHASPGGFVAQHHTRFTPYLALQMQAYGVTPILTVRNVLDALVSYDDMMLDWRGRVAPEEAWVSDPHALPRDYPQRPPEARYALLAPSLGVWLIQFFLSWKRGLRQQLLTPLVIQYERDVLDADRFVELVAGRLGFSEDQRARLRAYALAPDRAKSRLNVGQAGRGRALIPAATQDFLRGYAEAFRDELSDTEMAYLLG